MEKSIELVKDVYLLVQMLPKEEKCSLCDQIRRSSVSVPSNIAEGSGRNSTKEYIQFLYIALGSLCELETQIIITKEIGYIQNIINMELKITTIKK